MSFYTSLSGLRGAQTDLSTTANNIANVSTPGFKKSRVDFENLMVQTVRAPGSATSEEIAAPTGHEVGMGVRVHGTERAHSQGALQSTGSAPQSGVGSSPPSNADPPMGLDGSYPLYSTTVG